LRREKFELSGPFVDSMQANAVTRDHNQEEGGNRG
jgi:hypothetical protein